MNETSFLQTVIVLLVLFLVWKFIELLVIKYRSEQPSTVEYGDKEGEEGDKSVEGFCGGGRCGRYRGRYYGGGRNWWGGNWYYPYYSPLTSDWYYPFYNRPLWNRYAWWY